MINDCKQKAEKKLNKTGLKICIYIFQQFKTMLHSFYTLMQSDICRNIVLQTKTDVKNSRHDCWYEGVIYLFPENKSFLASSGNLSLYQHIQTTNNKACLILCHCLPVKISTDLPVNKE